MSPLTDQNRPTSRRVMMGIEILCSDSGLKGLSGLGHFQIGWADSL
jgi:hypothetical protein